VQFPATNFAIAILSWRVPICRLPTRSLHNLLHLGGILNLLRNSPRPRSVSAESPCPPSVSLANKASASIGVESKASHISPVGVHNDVHELRVIAAEVMPMPDLTRGD